MPKFLTLTRNSFRKIQSLNTTHNHNKSYVKCLHTSERKLQTKCWKCGAENMALLFCNSCSVIQQPSEQDYFRLIDIDQSYDVDMKTLTQKYRKLQSLLHPDKYSNKSEEEKAISQEYSSVINRAYSTLQSPVARGLYLLKLNGEMISENENESKDQEFLLEIMELNEEIEDATTPDQLLKLYKKNKDILADTAQDLSDAFKLQDVQKAKKILIKMKYYASISTQINSILRERGIVE